ncbi:MAG: hypothetical protein ABEH90_07225, partial [Halolamina sp.]
MADADDPTAIDSIAVTASDVISAYEARDRSDKPAVLRVTPPFSGRMRARLHVAEHDAYDDPRPVHVDPEKLLEAAPPYPEPDEIEDELRADPDAEYTTDRHHERYAAAVEDWRERAREAIADEITLHSPEGRHRVSVTV